MSGESKNLEIPSTANIEQVCRILSDIKSAFAKFIESGERTGSGRTEHPKVGLMKQIDNLKTSDLTRLPPRMCTGIEKIIGEFVDHVETVVPPADPTLVKTLSKYATALRKHDLMYTFPADTEGEGADTAAVSCAKLFKDICLEYFSVGYIDNIMTDNNILIANNIEPGVVKSIVRKTQLLIWRWKKGTSGKTPTFMMNGTYLTTTDSFVKRVKGVIDKQLNYVERLTLIKEILVNDGALNTAKKVMGNLEMVRTIKIATDYAQARTFRAWDNSLGWGEELFQAIQTILRDKDLQKTMEVIRANGDTIVTITKKIEEPREDVTKNLKMLRARLSKPTSQSCSRLVAIRAFIIADEHLLDDIGSNEPVNAKHRELVELLMSERETASDNAIVHAMYMHMLRHHRSPIYQPIKMGPPVKMGPTSDSVRTKHALHMGMAWLYRAAVHVYQKFGDGFGNMIETRDIDARVATDDTLTNRTQFIQYGKRTHAEVVTVRVGMVLFGKARHAYGLLLQVRILGKTATFRYTVLDVNFELEDDGYASALQPSQNMKSVLAGIFDTCVYVYEVPEYRDVGKNTSITQFSLCSPHTRLWVLVFVSAAGTGRVGLIANLRILKNRFDERTLTFEKVVNLMGDDWKKTMGEFVSSGVAAAPVAAGESKTTAPVAAPVAAGESKTTAPEEYGYPAIDDLKKHGVGYMDSSRLVSTWFVMKPPPVAEGNREFRYALAAPLPWCKMLGNITWVLLFLVKFQPAKAQRLIEEQAKRLGSWYYVKLSKFAKQIEPVGTSTPTPLQCEMIMETIQIIQRWEPTFSDLSKDNKAWIEQLSTDLTHLLVAPQAKQTTSSLRGTYDLRAQFVKLRL